MFGSVNNPSTSGFRGEQVIGAQHVSRPKEMANVGVDFGHHGVLMQTDKGNSYLLHSTPGAGTVVTNQALSNKWKTDYDIPVNGNKTVGQVFNESSGRTLNPFVNYGTSGTCINAAQNAEKALRK